LLSLLLLLTHSVEVSPYKNVREIIPPRKDGYLSSDYFFGVEGEVPAGDAPLFPGVGCAALLPAGVAVAGAAGCVPCGSGFGGMSEAEKRGSISSRMAS
jgi:hypothetical protein